MPRDSFRDFWVIVAQRDGSKTTYEVDVLAIVLIPDVAVLAFDDKLWGYTVNVLRSALAVSGWAVLCPNAVRPFFVDFRCIF